MAAYDHLPIFKAMMDATVMMEETVKGRRGVGETGSGGEGEIGRRGEQEIGRRGEQEIGRRGE